MAHQPRTASSRLADPGRHGDRPAVGAMDTSDVRAVASRSPVTALVSRYSKVTWRDRTSTSVVAIAHEVVVAGARVKAHAVVRDREADAALFHL